MKRDKVIDQLESVKEHSKIMSENSHFGRIWADDVIALEYAINKVKKDKAYMSSYWQGAWHMFLLILLIKLIDVLITVFWS